MAEKALREVHLEVNVAAADRLEQPARFVGAQLGRVAPGLEGGQKVGGRRGGFSHQADDPFTRSSTRSPPRSPRRSSMWPSNACAPHVIVVGSLAAAVSPPGLRAEADQREMDLFRGLAEWPPRMMVSWPSPSAGDHLGAEPPGGEAESQQVLGGGEEAGDVGQRVVGDAVAEQRARCHDVALRGEMDYLAVTRSRSKRGWAVRTDVRELGVVTHGQLSAGYSPALC